MKKFGIAVAVICILGVSTLWYLDTFKYHDLHIIDETTEYKISTMNDNLKEIFSELEINLRTEDLVEPGVDTLVDRNMLITIERAKPVMIHVDGETIEYFTTLKSVKSILDDQEIVLNEDDLVYPKSSSNLNFDRTIEVIRMKTEFEVKEETIDFETVIRLNEDMDAGAVKLISEGTPGLVKKTYKIIYRDDVEISREVEIEEVLVEAIDEVIEKGVDKLFVTSRGQPFRYSKIITMQATAYDLSVESCGKTPDHPAYGITYSGTKARPGVVAVDPKVIPLGSKLYVESLDYTKDYGFSSAEDTGSAIKGNKIDLFIASNSQALRYGRRYVRVYVLEDSFSSDMMKGYAQ